MKTENRVLMSQARESLSGKWGLAIGVGVLYILITGAANSIHGYGPVISFIVSGPLALGLAGFFLALSRNKEANFTQMFDGFNRFGESLLALLRAALFIVLWSLLFVIPGIIAAISYSQMFYIMSDNKEIHGKEAIEKSKKMMYGYKWKYFCLHLRFLGWFILSILTLGIGFFWLFPYMQMSTAKFYEDLKSGEQTSTTA